MSSSLSSNDSSLSSNDSSSDDDDHITKNKVLMFAVANVTNYFMKYVVKNPCRDSSMTGHRWVFEILNGHPIRCYQMFRMKKLVFLELCDILETKYNLKKTRNVSIYEQVGLFLYMLSQPDEDNEDIDSDEDESEVGPSTITWEKPDAQSTLQMERFRESLKNMFPTRI
ncbi:hypothetical protein JHK87_049445 [Glycine soja]|nr:hypothetical protein JHK87_049445 [Glycine soja]